MRKKYFEYLIDDSDVDLYIERGGLKSLIQYFAFIDELENVFDFRVVTTGIEEKTFFFQNYAGRGTSQYSCNMCIIQLGEPANRLSDETKENSSNIPSILLKTMLSGAIERIPAFGSGSHAKV